MSVLVILGRNVRAAPCWVTLSMRRAPALINVKKTPRTLLRLEKTSETQTDGRMDARSMHNSYR